MKKIIVSLFIVLTVFSINTFAADYPRQKAILEPGPSSIVAFSPDGSTLACRGPDHTVYLWDVTSEQSKTTSTGHTNWIESLAFSPDGSTLASGSSDKTIRLWDATSRQLKATLTGHSERINSVAFSPDGSTLASGSHDKTVRLWDVASAQPTALLIGHTEVVSSIAFSPDGSTLASGSHDKTVRLWDVTSRKSVTILTGHGVDSVAFSPDGSTLASGGSNTVHLWDVTSRERKTELIGHTRGVTGVAFSPDGSTLASGSWDETVRLWDLTSGRQKSVLIGHTSWIDSLAFSPDGSTLASGSWGMILLWDLTASATTSAVVSISPATVQSMAVGEQLTISLNITGGENVVGYEATVVFNPDALIYFSSANGDYLSDGAFFAAPVVEKNYVTLSSAALAGSSNGDGTLATITFQVVDAKASRFFLSQAALVDLEGERLFPCIENDVAEDETTKGGPAVEPVFIAEDVNSDGVVNILDLVLVSSNFGQRGENKADVNGDGVVDIVDLVKVAGALGNTADAPSIHPQMLAMFTAADVQGWLTQAQHLSLTDAASQRGIRFLEQFLAVLTPKETVLLPNYPNPFNPETWMPYQLAEPADVTLRIYAVDGTVVRTLSLGHQPIGVYQRKDRAAYWNGRNALGEPVASGVYFYTLTAGEFTATRKMLIRK